jgi:type I site-specific restriction-modification system R (restriction) subunit
VKVKADVGAQTETVWLIDWKHPERNRFAVAEEVTVKGATPRPAPSARTSCCTSTASRSACSS